VVQTAEVGRRLRETGPTDTAPGATAATDDPNWEFVEAGRGTYSCANFDPSWEMGSFHDRCGTAVGTSTSNGKATPASALSACAVACAGSGGTTAAASVAYPAGTCGHHQWGEDGAGAGKCGDRAPYPEGDAHLQETYADDAESCCTVAAAAVAEGYRLHLGWDLEVGAFSV
jgi:hypothetical protein